MNSVSIDFLREVDGKVDIQRILYDASPWDLSESTEEHMLRCYPDLKEFWKKML